MILLVSVLLLTLLLTCFLILYLYKRNKLKKDQIQAYQQQLTNKQEFVNQGLTKKIEEIKTSQTEVRKNASVEEREKLDKEVYNIALHLDNWDDFNREMNHAFNNIIITLNTEYISITRKEIIWCCLHLLDIPLADRMVLLDATSDSLYKLKQRLAHKLNLKTTKELSSFLKDKTEIKN
jgi:preprotein translocase subunit YajC